VYTLSVAADRRYQLQSTEANRKIDALLEQLRVPETTWRLYGDTLTTVLKMFEDGAGIANLKLTSAALKELRYGFKVFAPYRGVPKVTVFGSARTPAEHPVSHQAYMFGKRITEAGWMVITGAGSGVMGAAQHGATGERSFGLNIRLPMEQEANPWIADDPKHIRFNYFFTRKLFVQTGKAALLPLVLVDAPGGTYWKKLIGFMQDEMLANGMISSDDLKLFYLTDEVDAAATEIEGFYRVFHSQRYLGDKLLLRLRRPLSPIVLEELSDTFSDILSAKVEQTSGPLPAEGDELRDLPRLVLRYNRGSVYRLRLLLDRVNES
jgi:predicted Rossmann-fold nucleotide-binding protein